MRTASSYDGLVSHMHTAIERKTSRWWIRDASFMDEISADELYEGLLAYGFFAEKLPPEW